MKGQFFRKGLAGVMMSTLIVSTFSVPGMPVQNVKAATVKETANSGFKANYAEAFQKSMYFYDANWCGDAGEGSRLSWRGDCHLEDRQIPLKNMGEGLKGTDMSDSFIKQHLDALDPDGDGYVNLEGGFHDAGDHVNFGLPQSYSASTLGWGYYEFPEAYAGINDVDHIESILRHFNDFFLRCTFRDASGKVVAFAYQVGEGTSDHCYWGPPELQSTDRPAYFATSENPASDQCAGAAASLAINYLNFKDSDKEYAEKCLDTAIVLYDFAVENRGCGFSGGFYNSSFDDDEMSWAAVWLNIATGDEDYIEDIVSKDANGMYTGYLRKIINSTSDTWQNIWVHSWDTVWGGVFAKLAPITNDPTHWYFFRWNIEYWSGIQHENPSDQTFMAATPDDFKVVATWGSCRYNAAAQMCAMVYNKYRENQAFVEWCKDQMDYILGDNPMNRCYEVGLTENSAVHPHHRAAHGSLTNSMEYPTEHRHTLWGALVGGPDGDDYHEDITTDFVYNEVAIDYNAGFVGALAGLYLVYGQDDEPVADFPPKEEDEKPFYASAKIEQENKERTQLTVKIHNDTSLPPSFEDGLSARYFFDISEMLDAGQTIKDLGVQVMYDQALIKDNQAVKISNPIAWDEENGIYYIELSWEGNSFHGDREIHFALVPAMDKAWKTNWDPTNDFSRQGITKTDEDTDFIPVYNNGVKAYGEEPAKGEMVENFTTEINAPKDGTVLNVYDGETSTTLTASVSGKIEELDSIDFYANGEYIGTADKAPYSIKFAPQQSAAEDSKVNYEITAVAISVTGKEVESKPITVKAVYDAPITSTICFANKEINPVLDLKEGSNEFRVGVYQFDDFSNPTEKITSIKIYANGELIGSSNDSDCEATYIAPSSYPANKKSMTVVFTAVAKTNKGNEVEATPYTLTVLFPEKQVSVSGLSFQAVSQNTAAKANTIQEKFIFKNTGNSDIDLSKVTVRYFYKKDSNSTQTMFSDHSGLTLNRSPYYADVTKNVKADFVAMDTPTENADMYCEFSFDDVEYELYQNSQLECDVRIVNSDWSFFDQSNDYSFLDEQNIVVYYDGVAISGVEPF